MWAWERSGSRHQQQYTETQRKPGADRRMEQEVEQQSGETRAAASASTHCPAPTSLSGSITHLWCFTIKSSFSPAHFLWILVTCNQKKLETTLSTNLDCLAGQQDNFSINSKNNDTVMTVRGFWTFWFRRHCKILGNSVIVFLGLASQETTCKSNWQEKVVKDLSYCFSPGGQCGHTPQVDSILSSRARSTGPHLMTVRLTNCVIHQGFSHYKWWRASFWFIGFVFILLCVCFPIHCSVILS